MDSKLQNLENVRTELATIEGLGVETRFGMRTLNDIITTDIVDKGRAYLVVENLGVVPVESGATLAGQTVRLYVFGKKLNSNDMPGELYDINDAIYTKLNDIDVVKSVTEPECGIADGDIYYFEFVITIY